MILFQIIPISKSLPIWCFFLTTNSFSIQKKRHYVLNSWMLYFWLFQFGVSISSRENESYFFKNL